MHMLGHGGRKTTKTDRIVLYLLDILGSWHSIFIPIYSLVSYSSSTFPLDNSGCLPDIRYLHRRVIRYLDCRVKRYLGFEIIPFVDLIQYM